MKTFIYTKEVKSTRNNTTITLQVYRIKNNKPCHVCEVGYSTGSYRGEDHEIVNELVKIGELPKNVLDGSLTSYINFDKRDTYNLMCV